MRLLPLLLLLVMLPCQAKEQQTAEQNIGRLCFREGALLFDEFDRIFSDLFDKRHRRTGKLFSNSPKAQRTIRRLLALWVAHQEAH
jgi:hypothetical protein